MFLFYHPEQTTKNFGQLKGRLFESLLRRYLSASGYEVELRRKRHSAEYDLTGAARLDRRPLVGEAKAHGNPIALHDVAAFVGKLIPIHRREPHVLGLFLSTSQLTAEAEDYVSSLGDSPRLRILSGDALLTDIAERLELPGATAAQQTLSGTGVYPLSAHMLATEQGPYVLVIAAADTGATPAAFGVVRADGQLVAERAFLDDVRQRVPELQELVPVGADPGPDTTASPSSARSPIPEGLILGNDWADYRLPAPPAFFVGRRAVVDRIRAALLGDTHPGVVQVKSRSGVGKSSLMAFLAESLRGAGLRAQLYDARDVKSVLDLWAIVQRLTGAGRPAADYGDMERQLGALAAGGGPRTVLLVDQFESTFTDPDLYNAFELLAMAAVRSRPRLCVVFARKNDLLTTFDDQQITLERLNEVSESVVLDDFAADEAVQLIEAIGGHADRPVSAELKSYVLEFAQGFPWLLKRTMAHVLTLLRRGGGPLELLSSSLRLDDLFDEELAELDEVERDYLLRIARQLPATYHQLASYFDEDPYLPRVLDKLTRERLLRLSGSTYDTYNDVFKEYLVYRRLPEFRVSFVYRLGDAAVLSTFWRVLDLRRFTTEEMRRTLRRARGTTFNMIRELRNVGLLDRDGKGGWAIPELALEALERGRLGEYLRHQLLRNALVSDILGHLQATGPLSRDDLTSYLQDRFPFISASASTWTTYAGILLNWMRLVELVRVEGEVIGPAPGDRKESAQRIGNLRHRSKAHHKVLPSAFLPSARWRHIEAAALSLGGGSGAVGLPRKTREGLLDLVRLRLATPDGRLLVSGLEAVRASVARMLNDEPYRSYWAAVHEGANPGLTLSRMFQLAGLQRSTIDWRARVLLHWGLKLGVIDAGAPRANPRRGRADLGQMGLELPEAEDHAPVRGRGERRV